MQSLLMQSLSIPVLLELCKKTAGMGENDRCGKMGLMRKDICPENSLNATGRMLYSQRL